MKNRFKDRLLFIDTETGGVILEKHSLLSIGLVAWDITGGIVDTKEIFVEHDNYLVTKGAQNVNKFDLEAHKLKAVNPSQVIREIDEFCSKNFPADHKIIVAGHNIIFDISFLKFFLSQHGRSFENMFSHRSIDTASILQFLQISGKIDLDLTSSTEGFRYFKIKVDNRHGALSDSIATAELFKKMTEVV